VHQGEDYRPSLEKVGGYSGIYTSVLSCKRRGGKLPWRSENTGMLKNLEQKRWTGSSKRSKVKLRKTLGSGGKRLLAHWEYFPGYKKDKPRGLQRATLTECNDAGFYDFSLVGIVGGGVSFKAAHIKNARFRFRETRWEVKKEGGRGGRIRYSKSGDKGLGPEYLVGGKLVQGHDQGGGG